MQNIVLAANGADAAAVDALTQRHSELSGALAVKSIHLLDAVTAQEERAIEKARADLLAWCRSTLVPYLRREAEVLYPAVRPTDESLLLVQSLTQQVEHLSETAEKIETADAALELGVATVSLRVELGRHLASETEELLPYLAFSTQAGLSQLWARMARTDGSGGTVVSGTPAPAATGAATHTAGHVCACGIEDGSDFPTLDVREVPHAIRHATVFGALEAIAPGGGLVLIAPHDPLPLLAQIEQRSPGRFGVTYLMRQPDECRLQLLRQN